MIPMLPKLNLINRLAKATFYAVSLNVAFWQRGPGMWETDYFGILSYSIKYPSPPFYPLRVNYVLVPLVIPCVFLSWQKNRLLLPFSNMGWTGIPEAWPGIPEAWTGIPEAWTGIPEAWTGIPEAWIGISISSSQEASHYAWRAQKMNQD